MERLTLKKWQQWLLPSLIIIVICSIVYAAIRDNFHVVVNDKVYRSAQLSESTIKVFAHLKNIKTIINLRGANPNQAWYMNELKTAEALHIQHIDILLNSKKLPDVVILQQLADTLQNAPKPILVHCLSGSDRTGLASAMAMILLQDAPLPQAKKQFSWHYFVTSNKSVGKQVFSHYQHWLQSNHKSSNRDNFMKWVRSADPFA